MDKTPKMNMDVTSESVDSSANSSTWEEWFKQLVLWAAQNPWEFLFNVLMFLSPFFFISMLLSWQLAKAIESQEKKKKYKRDNISKLRKLKNN